MELAQIEEKEKLNTLYTQLELNSEGEENGESSENGGTSYDAITKLLEFKKAIADAIQEAGGISPENSTIANIEAFKERIVGEKGIVAEVTKDATATDKQILSGQTAWVKGKKVTGTMSDNEAVSSTLKAGESYTIKEGYHNGEGTVTAATLESQTQATATADDIVKDKTAWVNGNRVIGTKENTGLKILKSNCSSDRNYGVTSSCVVDLKEITNYQELKQDQFIVLLKATFVCGNQYGTAATSGNWQQIGIDSYSYEQNTGLLTIQYKNYANYSNCMQIIFDVGYLS